MKKLFGALAVSAVLVGNVEANPFKDVPANHWAYGEVNKVVQSGVMKGFKGGMFKGNEVVSRYEMATIISRLLDKVEGKSLSPDTKKSLDNLAEEFMDELDLIGARLTALENAFHEHVTEVNNTLANSGSHDGFKFSGTTRLRFENKTLDLQPAATALGTIDEDSFWGYRTHINVNKGFEKGNFHAQFEHFGNLGDRSTAFVGLNGATTNVVNDSEVRLNQAYFDLKINEDSTLLAGRMAIALGNESLIGRWDWNNASRSYDGLVFASKASDFGYKLWTLKLVENMNKIGTTPVGANEGELQGLDLDFDDVFDGKLHAHYYHAQGIPALAATNAGLDTVGFDWTMDKDEWHLYVQYAFQGGDNGVVGAGNVDFDGDMWNVKAMYDLEKDSQIGIEYTVYSGDDSTTAAENESFVPLVPDGHKFLGAADLFNQSNIEDITVHYNKKMNERNRFELAYHMFKLDDATTVASLWNLAAPAAVKLAGTTVYDDDLGTEIDLKWNHEYSKDVSIELGYSIFSAGDYFTANQAAGFVAPDATFGYVQTSIKF